MRASISLVTDLGKLLDPLADKVLVVCALAGLLERHIAPMWMVVLIIAREFLIMGLRQIAAHKQVILAAEKVGKHKTISQIVAILVSFVYLSLGEFGFGGTALAQFFGSVQIYLYWFALVITVLSGAIYFWKNAAMLNETIADPPVPSPASHATSPAVAVPAPLRPVPRSFPPSRNGRELSRRSAKAPRSSSCARAASPRAGRDSSRATTSSGSFPPAFTSNGSRPSRSCGALPPRRRASPRKKSRSSISPR